MAAAIRWPAVGRDGASAAFRVQGTPPRADRAVRGNLAD